MTPRKQYLIPVDDDGLPTLPVHSWARDKYVRSTMYAELFTTGMKHKWDQLVYIGICTGPGHVVIKESNTRVLASPLLALQVPSHKFDRYIFCDANPKYIEALKHRVQQDYPDVDAHYVTGDANTKIREIVEKIPTDESVLTFAFIDPFKLNIGFKVIETLADQGRVDILFTLMLYHDANRAWHNYITDNNDKVDYFLQDRNWRDRWEEASRANEHPVTFLAREIGDKMKGRGYIDLGIEGMHIVRTPGNTPLYHMAFFGRDSRAVKFWNEVLKYSSDQHELPLIF